MAIAEKCASNDNLADEAETAAVIQHRATMYHITKTEDGCFKNTYITMRFCAPNLENSEVVIINKLESVFCAQFEFRTQTEVNKYQTQRIGDYKAFGVQK